MQRFLEHPARNVSWIRLTAFAGVHGYIVPWNAHVAHVVKYQAGAIDLDDALIHTMLMHPIGCDNIDRACEFFILARTSAGAHRLRPDFVRAIVGTEMDAAANYPQLPASHVKRAINVLPELHDAHAFWSDPLVTSYVVRGWMVDVSLGLCRHPSVVVRDAAMSFLGRHFAEGTHRFVHHVEPMFVNLFQRPWDPDPATRVKASHAYQLDSMAAVYPNVMYAQWQQHVRSLPDRDRRRCPVVRFVTGRYRRKQWVAPA